MAFSDFDRIGPILLPWLMSSNPVVMSRALDNVSKALWSSD
jgi:hypothetical protein